MEKFKSLSNKQVHENELEILKKWEESNILEKTTKGDENFVFYDGPAFANGFPGLHHMIAKFLKDSVCKYQTMQGKKILRKIGWDTHGLPIENRVEKKLGFDSKKEIEKYGLDKFNAECRKSIKENEDEFVRLTKEMGQFIDTDHPYITCENDYIETEWWILKRFYDEGLFYEGNKIMPYCPRCGTGLASHEVAQGYKEISVNSVIVPFKLKSQDNTYLLVWTTTPWTLIANVAACVNPNESYIKANYNGVNYIVSEKLSHKVLGDEFEVVENYKGKDLEFQEYEQLMPFLSVDKKGFYVTCADYVTTEDGTGIVHIAPAFGADDAEVGNNYNLPFLNPVGEDGKYLEGPWKDRIVIDQALEIEIITWLKENNKLFKKIKMNHNYPHCWRCSTPLLYYAKPSYYIKVTEFKDKIIEANKKVKWYPDYVGEKRFANWLENLNDWAISRTRYWGTPIPLWKCTCGNTKMIGSAEELRNEAIEDIKDIDFHRPSIDDVHIKCSKCGKEMVRTPEVLDCWFDSGSMPYAQYHYPFENKELFESQFPADFIAEGIDQTRGWFYSLMVIGVFLMGEAPYKNVLVNDLLLDAEGKKMSKSRGNIVEPFTTMKEYGADTVRFYLPYASPVWVPLRFDMNGLKEVHSKFFNPLKNTYNFFSMYANIDNIDINECNIPLDNREDIDKWLISKYNRVLKKVTDAYEEYDLNKVVKALTEFVSEDLSNWYIRRNRNRFWGNTLNDSKKAVYITTYEVLKGISLMMAPVVPFLSDEIYTNLTGEYSVHTASFPKYDESTINVLLEEKMDLVRKIISIGRYVREEQKIRVRQPLSEILIDGKNRIIVESLVPLIKEELNVKKVTFVNDSSVYMNFTVKPNFRVVGKVFGANLKEFQEKLLELSLDEITKLRNNELINMEIGGQTKEISSDMVDIRVDAKEGFNVGNVDNTYVILNTTITDELLKEGIAREIVSKVQTMRKNKDLELTDRITIKYSAGIKITDAIDEFIDYIKKETLATNIEVADNLTEEFVIDEEKVLIEIAKN